VIEVAGLVTAFGRHVIHDGLDLEVRQGEVLAIVGGSGSGKSVLVREIIGLMRPTAGRIRLLGKELAELGDRDRQALRARTGMLFQDGALFSSLTVAQNIAVPLKTWYRLRPGLIDEIAGLKLALAGLERSAATKYPSELSGGMRKRAGIARALALDPEILFLDEPTAGLDPIAAGAFDELIQSLQQSLGLTVVMITHDLDSLDRIADRVAVLVDKRAITGTLDEIRAHPHPWISDYFKGPRGRAAASASTATVSRPSRTGRAAAVDDVRGK
jgi:phospholipid/cholesterol/gamma-HCH transport system ATP-binding protein